MGVLYTGEELNEHRIADLAPLPWEVRVPPQRGEHVELVDMDELADNVAAGLAELRLDDPCEIKVPGVHAVRETHTAHTRRDQAGLWRCYPCTTAHTHTLGGKMYSKVLTFNEHDTYEGGCFCSTTHSRVCGRGSFSIKCTLSFSLKVTPGSYVIFPFSLSFYCMVPGKAPDLPKIHPQNFTARFARLPRRTSRLHTARRHLRGRGFF